MFVCRACLCLCLQKSYIFLLCDSSKPVMKGPVFAEIGSVLECSAVAVFGWWRIRRAVTCPSVFSFTGQQGRSRFCRLVLRRKLVLSEHSLVGAFNRRERKSRRFYGNHWRRRLRRYRNDSKSRVSWIFRFRPSWKPCCALSTRLPSFWIFACFTAT